MKIVSRAVQIILLTIAYLFAAYALPIVFSESDPSTAGYRYVLLLTATLLLLAGHGLVSIRRNQLARMSGGERVRDVTTNVAMSVWEIFFGWLCVCFALLFLYYAAPTDRLEEWIPRLFLCLVVLFGASYQRALVFIYSMLPFVLTITVMSVFQGWLVDPFGETWAKIAFVLLDLIALWAAARLARIHGVFGVSELELPAGPGRIGGKLHGVIRSPQQATPASGFQLDLSCIRQTREAGRRASGEILYHFRKIVRGDVREGDEPRCEAPFEFALPETALASVSAEGARIAWQLRATAQMPETNFGCSFEIPVADSRPSSDEPWSGAAGEEPGDVVPESREGLTSIFRFAAHWNAATELLTAVYFLFWLQLMWLTSAGGVDWTVWLMFGVGLWFLYLLISPWIWEVETRIGDDLVEVRRRFLFWKRTARYAVADIKGVEASGDGVRTGLIDGADFYRVRLLSWGKKRTIGMHIRERRTAERIAERMWERIREERGERPE